MMTLKEIHDYITPLLADESMAAQDATLVIHCSDGDISPYLTEKGKAARNQNKAQAEDPDDADAAASA